jgi:phenylalanyl-tRNA synthetase beta chain
MRVPLSWLKDYVDIDVPVEVLQAKLSGAGVPVETLEYLSPDVSGVVAGFVKAVRPHPDADKLVLCDVDMGAGTLQIVTGAPNVRQGHCVPVAVHGAKLSGGLKIKRSKIRGEESHGMMCSAKELGIEIKDLPIEQREGILILPPCTPPGASVVELYCLNDPILIVESFANRPDQLSILGIAREAAAALGKKMKMPPLDYPEMAEGVKDLLKVKIWDYQLCRKYSGRIIQDMPMGPSPLWMQGRLHAAGIRAINGVVDVTNYVMMEFGQPLHAFDFDKVKGGRIIVRAAKMKERLKTIDGEDRKLDPSMLVIADRSDAVAIAGVMGGLESEVGDATSRILLESACFSGTSIRRTSIKLGLRSESSSRFEKGIDFHQVDLASRRACRLMSQAGGKVLAGEVSDHVDPPREAVIRLRPARVNRVLGTDIPRDEMKRLLSGLEFQVEDNGDDFQVTVPTVRQDVNCEIDLVEEVARLHGYDDIPTTSPIGQARGGVGEARAFDHHLREMMIRCGLNECITPGLYEAKITEDFGLSAGDLLEVQNPITEDQAVLRGEGVPHLLQVARRNIAARRNVSRLFEISNFYRYGEMDQILERRELTIVLTGPSGDRENDFFALKGIIEFMLAGLGVEAEFVKGEYPYLHPGKTAAIMAGDVELGMIGVLGPRTACRLEMEQEAAVARVLTDRLRGLCKPRKYRPIPRFPGVRRDLALLMDEGIPALDVKKVMLEKGAPLIDEARCFDEYKGGQVPPGKKSLAFALTFSAPDKTLTDGEVQEKIDAIVSALGKELSVSLRG